MSFCLDRLKDGQWLHIYPEGKVNVDKEYIRLKWGVGQLISTAPVTPIVIPMYHLGMDEVLPTKKPYIPRIGKSVTVCIGEPIDFDETLKELDRKGASQEQKRKVVTDIIDQHLQKLKIETEIWHAKHTNKG